MSDKLPESLQLFLATLTGLNSTEIKKAKELYIKNEITECQAAIKSSKYEYLSMAFFLLIPIFWPMLFSQRKERKIRIEVKKAKINNALLVWKDDLTNSYGELKALLNTLEVSK